MLSTLEIGTSGPLLAIKRNSQSFKTVLCFKAMVLLLFTILLIFYKKRRDV